MPGRDAPAGPAECQRRQLQLLRRSLPAFLPLLARLVAQDDGEGVEAPSLPCRRGQKTLATCENTESVSFPRYEKIGCGINGVNSVQSETYQ